MQYSDNPNQEKAQLLLKIAKDAFSETERQNVENIWSELAEFILPSQNGKFNGDKTKADKNKDRRIFDTTAPTSCRDLASSMHSTITNPSAKWGRIRFSEIPLNNMPSALSWLETATNAIFNALNDSNFDSQVGRCYQSLTGLGTMAILEDVHRDERTKKFNGLNFTAWHLSEIAYAENNLGVVDCIYRKFSLSYRQAYEKFGDAIGDDGKDKAEKTPFKECTFYHCIYPRPAKDVKMDPYTQTAAPNKRPFASDYIMEKGSKLVLEDGYYEFPAFCARWLTLPGEKYGYGPGHVARADVLTLNTLHRQLLKGLAKAVDPVTFVEQNNLLSGDMRPGKIVPVRNLNGIKENVTQSRFDIGFLVSKDLRDSIKSAFYIDKLMLPPRNETGEMTAYEIQQRLSQMQVVLGPPLSRLNYEFLQPLFMRTLNILRREGIIPPIPQDVIAASQAYPNPDGTKTVDLDISFVNSLARSQQMAELQNVSSWLQEVGGLAQIKPEALDYINEDEAVEKMARIRDIPESLVRTDNEVKAIRDQRKQQQQAMMGLQAADQGANIVKNMSQAQGAGKIKE